MQATRLRAAPRWRAWTRWTAIALAVLVVGFAAGVFGVGELLSRPVTRVVGPAPAGFAASSVVLHDAANGAVAGWFARGTPGAGAVLLLHGVRGDRRQMLGRAKFLHAAGYSVLLIDLHAHGETDGTRITFGHREAAGVTSAMQFLRQTLPGERVGVVGVSLGAASLVLSGAAPDAVVLESMYPTFTEAVANRLATRLGALGAPLAPVLLWQLPLRLGITADQLRPIDELPRLRAPVLIAVGTRDRHTTVAETRRLFDAANAPKDLWLVEGAAHVDLHAFDRVAYEGRVGAFLGKYLLLAN